MFQTDKFNFRLQNTVGRHGPWNPKLLSPPELSLFCRGASTQSLVHAITCQSHHLPAHLHSPSPRPLQDQPSLLTSEELK